MSNAPRHRAHAVGDIVTLANGTTVKLRARSEELDGRVYWVVDNGRNYYILILEKAL